MRQLFVVVLLLMLVIPGQGFPAITPPNKPQPFGKVEVLRGTAEKRIFAGREMKTEPLTQTSHILTQEVIATEIDGIVTIETLSGDEITLFPSSRIMIRQAGDGRYQVKLVHGKLKVKTRSDFHAGNGDRMEIQTFNTVLGPTGPSEFTIFRDLVESCRPLNSPLCPTTEYYSEASKLLKQNTFFSSVYVSKASSPVYVSLLHGQEWDNEKYLKLKASNGSHTLGEREWIIASDNKLKKQTGK